MLLLLLILLLLLLLLIWEYDLCPVHYGKEKGHMIKYSP